MPAIPQFYDGPYPTRLQAFTALSEMAGDALALAVVDDAGVLVTTLSVSDLRNLEAVGQLGQR